MFSIYDSIAGAFMRPFFSLNRGLAIRELQRALDDKNCDLYKNRKDCSLYAVGEFDDTVGEITPVFPPACLGKISDFILDRDKDNKHDFQAAVAVAQR